MPANLNSLAALSKRLEANNNSSLNALASALLESGRGPLPRRLSELSDNTLLNALLPKKRKVFFSFHYDDVMRVNNVRNAFKLYNPSTALIPTFYDSSLWESRKLESDESLKRLIRDGVSNTSAICVLVGSDTWRRPWVRYEIARSVIDRKGLLAVDINCLNHHERKVADPIGINPLSFIGVGKQGGVFKLFEKEVIWTTGGLRDRWFNYAKHTQAIEVPTYMMPPKEGKLVPLDTCVQRHDYVRDDGPRHIGRWIDDAAKCAGR